MIYQYQSPLEKSRQYLMSKGGNLLPEELEAIERAKSVGATEEAYIPALALNRMKKEDQQLSSMYDDYKSSPSTFFSKFKSQYGEGDKGVVGKVLGFVQNAIVDIGETGEEIYGAVTNPIETGKGILSLGKALDFRKDSKESKEIRSSLWKAITDNFGSVEKAKETFYENPFDVLSTLIPVAGAIGKTGKVSKTLGTISKAVDIAAEAGMAGKVAQKGIKGLSYTVDKLKDYANIDNYIMGKMMKTPRAASDLAKDAYGSILYGSKGGDAFKTMIKSTEDPARIASQAKYSKLTPEQVADVPEEMISKVKKQESASMKEAFKEVGEEGPAPVAYTETGSMINRDAFEGYTFSPGRGENFIDLKPNTYEGRKVVVSEDIRKAQNEINQAFVDSGLKKSDFKGDIHPDGLEIFRKKLDEISAKTRGTPKNMIDVLAGEVRQLQNRTFPKLEKVRKEFSEAYSKIETLKTEIGKATKDSTIYNRVATLINDTGLSKETIDFFAKRTGVNLEDLAVALKSKDVLGRFGKSQVFGGALGMGAMAMVTGNPAFLFGILGTTAVSSPALMYQLAKFTGPKKAIIVKAISKTTGASSEAVTSMLDKISKAADASKFKKTVSVGRFLGKVGGKVARKPESYAILQSILERIQGSEEAASISTQREELDKNIEELGKYQPEMPEQTTEEPQSDLMEFQDQVPEGAQINPNYLR